MIALGLLVGSMLLTLRVLETRRARGSVVILG